MKAFNISVIGEVESCFKQKFGIPKQPQIATAAKAKIHLFAPYKDPQALIGLESFSHLWVMFIFHQCLDHPWRALVRPPRLGGNKKKGVFATRSPFRPNNIGLSVVKLEQIACENGRSIITVSGHDFLDGTPVLDLKPYLPYVDSVPEAFGAFAHEPSYDQLRVEFSETALASLTFFEGAYDNLSLLITQVIAQDPRPAYKDQYDKVYGLNLFDLNIKWTVKQVVARVLSIEKCADFEQS